MSGPTVAPTKPKRKSDSEFKLLPPYNVIILNDDDHSFEFVITVLRKVFSYPLEKAFQLTQLAHEQGRAVVWTGSKEVAELKAEQIHTLHEIRAADNRPLGPVGCIIEPAPQ